MNAVLYRRRMIFGVLVFSRNLWIFLERSDIFTKEAQSRERANVPKNYGWSSLVVKKPPSKDLGGFLFTLYKVSKEVRNYQAR